MNDPADVWIVSVPVRSPEETAEVKDWIEELCDASPVEIDLVDPPVTWLEAYFEEETPARIARQALLTAFPRLESGVRRCEARDWTTFWRHHFQVGTVGDHLLIVPEWLRGEADVPEDRQVILINPGLSFGTGDHFTTRFCLGELDRLHTKGVVPERMLDAGCGSAILGIAARKFGWPEVLAVDHDELSIGQARENLALNGVSDGVELRRMDLTLTWPPGHYPLVVANLYGGLLMELAGRLVRCCTGTLILSGVRVVEAEAVSTVFARLGAVERRSEADHEWCGLVLDCP